LFDGLSNFEAIDKKFAPIDLTLFIDEIKTLLLNYLFEEHVALFSWKIGFARHLNGASFRGIGGPKSSRPPLSH
jgi:hypothetical protein